jgi:hypothetical protein
MPFAIIPTNVRCALKSPTSQNMLEMPIAISLGGTQNQVLALSSHHSVLVKGSRYAGQKLSGNLLLRLVGLGSPDRLRSNLNFAFCPGLLHRHYLSLLM